jgi:hypothetical protein
MKLLTSIAANAITNIPKKTATKNQAHCTAEHPGEQQADHEVAQTKPRHWAAITPGNRLGT